MKEIYIYTFYRFKVLNDIKIIKKKLDQSSKNKLIFGTLLIANEGLNGTISGAKNDIDEFILVLKKLLKIRKLPIKKSLNKFIPFYRLKIRIKKEIVSLGDKTINTEKLTGKYILPKDWDNIINDKNYTIIDTRNLYEVNIGTFKNSKNPKINSFREFPQFIINSGIKKNSPIAMFCTGGIRCEKASSYLLKNGYKDVSQLSGGILNYLEYKKGKKNNRWRGECFVFDNRVAVNRSLNKGKYDQCYGCRHPITEKEKLSKYFKKGATCPYCYKKKSSEKIIRSLSRQIQIDKAEAKGERHSFMKLKIKT